MLEEIKGLVGEINTTNKEVMKVSNAIVELDSKRLEVIINTAMSGLSFDKIWSSKKYTISGESEISPVEYEYLRHEETNNFIKGIKVGQYKGEGYQTDICCEKEDLYELWLLPNQFIVTRMTGTKVKEQWGRASYNRVIVQRDVDVFELSEDLSYKWDIDVIVSSLVNNLKLRKDDLSYRLVKQVDRLEKLKSLQI